MQHQHTRPLLRVANACHPDMDDRQRHRILLAAADEAEHADWLDRLRERDDREADPTDAMDLLRDLERRASVVDDDDGVEGYDDARTGCPTWRWVAVALLLLLLVLLGRSACR